jgi:hypothetical protein
MRLAAAGIIRQTSLAISKRVAQPQPCTHPNSWLLTPTAQPWEGCCPAVSMGALLYSYCTITLHVNLTIVLGPLDLSHFSIQSTVFAIT